jgi:hypothetical protein
MGRDMEKSGMIKGYIRRGIEFKALSCLLDGNQVSSREICMCSSFNKTSKVVEQWEFCRENNVKTVATIKQFME